LPAASRETAEEKQQKRNSRRETTEEKQDPSDLNERHGLVKIDTI
jgi:hypothetical protein